MKKIFLNSIFLNNCRKLGNPGKIYIPPSFSFFCNLNANSLKGNNWLFWHDFYLSSADLQWVSSSPTGICRFSAIQVFYFLHLSDKILLWVHPEGFMLIREPQWHISAACYRFGYYITIWSIFWKFVSHKRRVCILDEKNLFSDFCISLWNEKKKWGPAWTQRAVLVVNKRKVTRKFKACTQLWQILI